MYYYETSATCENRYDIIESGGGVIARSVPFDLVESIVNFLNSKPTNDANATK